MANYRCTIIKIIWLRHCEHWQVFSSSTTDSPGLSTLYQLTRLKLLILGVFAFRQSRTYSRRLCFGMVGFGLVLQDLPSSFFFLSLLRWIYQCLYRLQNLPKFVYKGVTSAINKSGWIWVNIFIYFLVLSD